MWVNQPRNAARWVAIGSGHGCTDGSAFRSVPCHERPPTVIHPQEPRILQPSKFSATQAHMYHLHVHRISASNLSIESSTRSTQSSLLTCTQEVYTSPLLGTAEYPIEISNLSVMHSSNWAPWRQAWRAFQQQLNHLDLQESSHLRIPGDLALLSSRAHLSPQMVVFPKGSRA